MLLQMLGASCVLMCLSVFLCYRLLADELTPQKTVSTCPTDRGYMAMTMRSNDVY